MTECIDSFSGRWEFLSNFYPVDVVLPLRGGIVAAPSVEHAYQASKTFSAVEQMEIVNAKTSGGAKRLGRDATIRPDWEQIKLAIMLNLLRQKFIRREREWVLSRALIETRDLALVEGNHWGDTYWGVCNGIGENWLGRLLMVVRSELSLINTGVRQMP